MICQTEGCQNEARLHRKLCHKCEKRKYREKYPLKYWYDTLKMNAKRRGKDFSLTLEQFETFCKQTGYNELKGKTASSLSIDRINNDRGYCFDNIRAITLSENSSKKDLSVVIDEYCPF
jgi:hypothetical protein